MDESLEAFALRHLRSACDHWSVARDTSGNMDVVECEVAAAMEGRVKEAIKQLSGEVESLSAQVAESDRLAEYANKLCDEWQLRAIAAEAQVAELKKDAEPTDGLLMSMALRYDHGLADPHYYDQPLFAGGPSHAQRLRSTITIMRQLHEEVIGKGFYSPDKEQWYKSLLDAAKESGDA